MNVNLQKSGALPVDQKFIDTLQSDFEIYYADQHMADNKALIKFVQWIRRNQEREQKPDQYQTSAQKTATEMDRWKQGVEQALGGERDITPKKHLLIEGVGHA